MSVPLRGVIDLSAYTFILGRQQKSWIESHTHKLITIFSAWHPFQSDSKEFRKEPVALCWVMIAGRSNSCFALDLWMTLSDLSAKKPNNSGNTAKCCLDATD